MALPRMAGRGAARVLLVTVITQLAIVPFVMAQLEPAPAPTIGTPPPPPGRPPPGNPPPALPPPGHPPPARSPPGNPPPGHPPPALPPPGSPGAIPGSDESGSKLNVGAIVGGVIGGALATVLVILGVLWCLLKKKERELANGGGDKTLPTEHAPPTHAPGVSAARRTPLPKPGNLVNVKSHVELAECKLLKSCELVQLKCNFPSIDICNFVNLSSWCRCSSLECESASASASASCCTSQGE